MAGHVSIGGSVIDWHGLACSGQLQQQFPYGGPADLERTAISLVSALDPAYYAGVQHTRATEESSAIKVSGHQAWKIEFTMDYTDGASQGLTWTTELGAVVVVDRGAGQFPGRVLRLGARQPRHPEGRHLPQLAPGELTGRASAGLGDADVAAAAVHLDRVAGRVVGRHRGAVVAAARRGS